MGGNLGGLGYFQALASTAIFLPDRLLKHSAWNDVLLAIRFRDTTTACFGPPSALGIWLPRTMDSQGIYFRAKLVIAADAASLLRGSANANRISAASGKRMIKIDRNEPCLSG
jgi:hypothetical protein